MKVCSELASVALDAGLDTAATVERLAGPLAYIDCCVIANRFEAGELRYAEYLEQLALVLARAEHRMPAGHGRRRT